MKESPIIQVNNVYKEFEIRHGAKNSPKEFFAHPFHRVRKEIFFALDDVTFNVGQGEFVGIIGRNGSGKSTLLKLLAQIYEPTSGNIQVNGSMVPFLELGVGFNTELTGRENVFLNGTILGMKKKFLEKHYDEIVEFSEIGQFIDIPVKNYSSGMIVRLAFAIAVQAEAEIYLLDEILGVGDIEFQKKSLAKMRELLSGGSTAILVSHSMEDIKKYCKRVLLLEHGKLIFDGDSSQGIKQYLKLTS